MSELGPEIKHEYGVLLTQTREDVLKVKIMNADPTPEELTRVAHMLRWAADLILDSVDKT